MENLSMKDLTTGQVRGRPITPTQLEVQALSPARMLQPNTSDISRSTGRTKQTNTKSPDKMKVASATADVGAVVEVDAGFTTLVVTTKDDFNFDIDEIPIAKLDFSNVSMNADKETPNAAKSKSVGKGKTAMSYE